MPAVFLRLMSLFPQPIRRSPAVEYVPQRRRVGESAGSRTS
jgi:hypothetical protein